MPISRSQMPRQMYGLGSIVKSIGKTIKKVVKSPIGKAAILGLGAYGLGGGFGAGFKFGNLPGAGLFSGKGAGLGSMFGKVKNLYSGLSGTQKLMGAAGSLGLAALAGAPEEVQMESQRNVGALRQYLASYYKNLGYSADQIAENVARDTSEYTSGQGGYAMGGRVNYQVGGEVSYDATDPIYGSSAITVTPETVADTFGNQVQQQMGNTYNPPLIKNVMQNQNIAGNPNGVGITNLPGAEPITNLPIATPDRPITNLPGAEPITNLPVSDPTIRNQADIADPVTGKTIPKNFMSGFQSFLQESGAMNRPMTGDVVSYRLPDGAVQQGNSTMRGLMNQYLKSIGQSPTTGVPASDRRINTNASPLAQAAMANGGRISLKNGTPKQEIVKPSDSMMVDTTTSNPMPKEKSLKENLDFVKETKGGVSPSTTMYMFKMYLDEALKKGQITKEKYNKMLMPFFGKTSEGITRDFERYEQSMAYGGRMGYESGTENPLAKLLEDIPLTKGPYKIKRDKDGKIIPPPPPLRGPYKIKRDKDGKIIPPPPPLLLRNKSANGGRINRAYGSDDLVEQASGIEGLDININPKGVKELDLRETGGFIPPVGVKEKADDIPAMLSNNEFVFTADAVRAAGGGSVNKGAQIMYDTMKKLENGGTV